MEEGSTGGHLQLAWAHQADLIAFPARLERAVQGGPGLQEPQRHRRQDVWEGSEQGTQALGGGVVRQP